MKEIQIIRIMAILLLVGVGLLIFRKHVQTEAFADMQTKKKPAATNPQEMVDAARNLLEKIDNPELLHSMMQTAMGGGLIDPSKVAGFLGSQHGRKQEEEETVGEDEEGEEGQQ